MKVGTGYSNNEDSFENGRKVAEIALEDGAISRPSGVLAFCGGAVDHNAFYSGLRDVLGQAVPIVGGSAVGVITRSMLSYEGYPAGAAIIESDSLDWHVVSAADLNKDERTAGEQMGKQLLSQPDNNTLLLFYDSLKKPATDTTPPILNASLPLIEGLESASPHPLSIIGGGLLGDLKFSTSFQFCGDHVGVQEAMAVMLNGDFTPHYKIMHGCTPHDGVYHTVTRSKGAQIFEVDGKPVVDLINNLYGNPDWQKQMPVRRLTFGVNKGEKFAAFNEGDFVNRLIAGVSPTGESVILFEPDLAEGSEFLFMLRDAEEMIHSARTNTAALFDEIHQKGQRPVFGLYIDCAGRVASYSWTRTEEALEIVNLFNKNNTPLLGFLSGVEVAPFLGCNRGLDWTGVLMILAN